MRIDVRNGTEIWQPTHRGKLVGRTDLSILDQYNGEVRGFCNYYAIANNRSKLHKFRYIMEYSFYKTLACKYRTTKGKIIAQYRIVKDIGVKFRTSMEMSASDYCGRTVLQETPIRWEKKQILSISRKAS